jgi:hypothetical protein
MKKARSAMCCAYLLALCLLLYPWSQGVTADDERLEPCSKMTAEVSSIARLKLRQNPLEIHAPEEGLLRGCTWSEEGGGVSTFGITKEPAGKYSEEHEGEYRKAFAEKFKQLDGFGEKAFVAPLAFDGWTACALRTSDCTCVEITGEATTAEQATKLLRLALDRF